MTRGFCFRNYHTADVATSVPGNLVNLQVVPEAVPLDRNRVSANPGTVTVIRHGVSAGKTCVPFPTDASPVQRRPVTLYHDISPAVLDTVPDQWKRPGELAESITVELNSLYEAGRSILQEQDDVSGCRTTMLQDRDACFAQRNPIPVQQDSPPEQRNSLPLAPDSVQEQLSGVLRPLLMPKVAKSHQFSHFRRFLPSNHTHGDSHVTTHFLYLLSRRHNASICFTQQ